MIVGGQVIANTGDGVGPRVLFIIAAVFSIGLMIPVAMGYLEEKKATPEEISLQRQRHMNQPEASFLSVLMFGGSITVCIVALVCQDITVNFFLAVAVGLVLLIAYSVLLTPLIAKFNAFCVMHLSVMCPCTGAAFYFFTDTELAYPDGPHFSAGWFNTVLGVVTIGVGMVALIVYQRYMSSWKYRGFLICTQVTMACFTVINILMFARVTKRIGISDHAVSMFLTIVEGFLLIFQLMPHMVIMSYLCPKGMEATMFSLLLSSRSLAMVVSNTFGAYVLLHMGVIPGGFPGEGQAPYFVFQNLWKVAAISTGLPLLVILIFWKLIPDARQDESLGLTEADHATKGSLWRRWTKTV
jgi:hypothetical protein